MLTTTFPHSLGLSIAKNQILKIFIHIFNRSKPSNVLLYNALMRNGVKWKINQGSGGSDDNELYSKIRKIASVEKGNNFIRKDQKYTISSYQQLKHKIDQQSIKSQQPLFADSDNDINLNETTNNSSSSSSASSSS